MAPTADASRPRTIGRYRVLDVLGRGGMGVVFRARDPETDALVAIKTVSVADAAMVGFIRREIHALRRIRHPAVVRVLDQGVEEGIPWYAMELLQGRTLRGMQIQIDTTPAMIPALSFSADLTRLATDEALIAASRSPEAAAGAGARRKSTVDLGTALTLLRRLCEPLAFVHGRGIVHRDLKPENVFIRPDGGPVLVDFGVASSFGGARGREVLEVGGLIAGSAEYMSPEQARGELCDARADLYALGCMLYECVTGEPPFPGRNLALVLHKHLHVTPTPPSDIIEGLDPGLEAIILRLLQKKPQDRFGYADDVAAALAALGAEGSDEAQLPPAAAYLYRPSFAGRAAALGELDAAVDGTSAGGGGLLLVGGESGVGKTRLVMEAATTAARRHRMRVVAGQCVAVGIPGAGSSAAVRAAPLHPLRPLLTEVADLCRERGDLESERLLGRHGLVLAPFEPELGTLPGQRGQAEPLPLPAEAARTRILAALWATLDALALDEPVLLVLDDLQWADELTLSFLASIEDHAADGPRLLVIGTYRTEETTSALRELVAAPHTRGIVIGRLGEGEVGEIVRDMLALDEAPRALVSVLAAQSNGNPFFVSEYLRAAVGEDLIVRDRLGNWRLLTSEVTSEVTSEATSEAASGVTPGATFHAPLPASLGLSDLVGRRLAGLGRDALSLVRMASVLGRAIDLDVLARAAGLDEVAGMEATEELVGRHILEEAESGRLRFAHDKLREIAYAAIGGRELRDLHERAAITLESSSRGAPELALLYPVLAHHYGIAGTVDKTLEYLEKAGEQAIGTAAYREAAGFFSRAIALDEQRHATRVPAHVRARWERRLGQACFSLGDLPASGQRLGSALAHLGHPVPTSPAQRGLALAGQVLRQAGHLLGLRRPAPPASALPVLAETAEAAAAEAFRCYFVNDIVGQLIMSLLSVNEAERARPAVHVAGPYIWLGYTAGLMRMHGLAHTYFERARENARRTNDRAGESFSRSLEAVYRIGFAHWGEARASCRLASDLLRALPDPQHFELNEVVIAQASFYTGDIVGSRAAFAALLASASKRANDQHLGWGLYGQGRELVLRGQLDEGVALLSRANEHLATTTDRATELICCAWLAAAHLLGGDVDRARAMADRTAARTREAPPAVVFTLDGFALAAEIYLELAERAEAGPAARALTREAHRATSELGKFALAFPFGEPALLRCQGRLDALGGRRARAARRIGASVARAEALGMPLEVALGREAEAGLHGPGSSEGREARGEAVAAYERLGFDALAARARGRLGGGGTFVARDGT